MRGADDIAHEQQRRTHRRFFFENVQGRAGDNAFFQGVFQGFFINQAAAGAVDDHDAPLHLFKGFFVDDVGAFRGFREMQGDEIGPGE